MSFLGFYFVKNGRFMAGNVLGAQKTCFISLTIEFYTTDSCSKQKIEEKNFKVYLGTSPGSPRAIENFENNYRNSKQIVENSENNYTGK